MYLLRSIEYLINIDKKLESDVASINSQIENDEHAVDGNQKTVRELGLELEDLEDELNLERTGVNGLNNIKAKMGSEFQDLQKKFGKFK